MTPVLECSLPSVSLSTTNYLASETFTYLQPQNFPFSQILPSIDIWHLFGLISWISGLLYSFFLGFSIFSSFLISFF